MNFSHHKESDVLGQNEEKKRYDMQLPFQLSYLKMSVFWSPFFTRIAILEKKKHKHATTVQNTKIKAFSKLIFSFCEVLPDYMTEAVCCDPVLPGSLQSVQ